MTERKRAMSLQSIAMNGQIPDVSQQPSNDNGHKGIFVEETVDGCTHQKYADRSRHISL